MPAKKPAKKRTRGFLVDDIRAQLSAEDCAEFDRLASFRPGLLDLQRYLGERGHYVSVTSLSAWFDATYGTGAEAKRINLLAATYRGLDAHQALEMASGLALTAAAKMVERLDARAWQVDDPAQSLQALLREARAAAAAAATMRTLEDRRELELAGAYRLAELLRVILAEAPWQDALGNALEAALRQIDSEAGRGQ